jgi:hypothetical protein
MQTQREKPIDPLDAAFADILHNSFSDLFYDQLLYGPHDKWETFFRWRPHMTPAQRVTLLEQVLDYELWCVLQQSLK